MQQLTGIVYLNWLENKQDTFLSSAKLVGIDRQGQWNSLLIQTGVDGMLMLVSYGAGYHAYCLSAGCFVRQGGRFRNIVDWVAIIELG